MKYKKMLKNFSVLILVMLVGADLQAKSFTDKAKSAWESTKKSAESAWESTKSGVTKAGDQVVLTQKKASDEWNKLDPKTRDGIKNALIGAGVAAGTLAVGAGLSYALSGDAVPDTIAGDAKGASQYAYGAADTFSAADAVKDNSVKDEFVRFIRNDTSGSTPEVGFLDHLKISREDQKDILERAFDPSYVPK